MFTHNKQQATTSSNCNKMYVHCKQQTTKSNDYCIQMTKTTMMTMTMSRQCNATRCIKNLSIQHESSQQVACRLASNSNSNSNEKENENDNDTKNQTITEKLKSKNNRKIVVTMSDYVYLRLQQLKCIDLRNLILQQQQCSKYITIFSLHAIQQTSSPPSNIEQPYHLRQSPFFSILGGTQLIKFMKYPKT